MIEIELKELQLERIQINRRQMREVKKLHLALSRTNLGAFADSFKHAMNSLGQEFMTAEETILDFLARLAQASQNAIRTNFDALFSRPTQEQAATNLRLAQLRLQRQNLLAGGRTEEELAAFLKPIDAEIAALEASNALRTAETAVLRAQLDIADQTLITDQQLLSQSIILIGAMKIQSRITHDVNLALGLQQLAFANATTKINNFARALEAASSVIGGAGSTLSINVSGQSMSREQLVRLIAEESEKALRRANMAGSFVTTGAFTP